VGALGELLCAVRAQTQQNCRCAHGMRCRLHADYCYCYCYMVQDLPEQIQLNKSNDYNVGLMPSVHVMPAGECRRVRW
jgi:hypothetical protein